MSIINVNNLSFAYDDSPEEIFRNVSFHIDTDWKLGLCGRNGRGKTTFLKLLQGKYSYSGSITSNADFLYFPFDVPDDAQNVSEIAAGIAPNAQPWEFERELSLLETDADILYRPFNTLSQGERTKILLAALFLRENAFLLIDEPTNHLDGGARESAARYLNSKQSFILVSHDRNFLDNCVNHILSINKSNIEVQKGNFSSWWANKQQQDNFELQENTKLQKDIAKLKESAKRAADWADKTEKGKFGKDVPDRGFVGHKAAKMMQRSKSIENRRLNAADEKSKLLQNIEYSSELTVTPLARKGEILRLKNVSAFYGDKKVCENVSFDLKSGERAAIAGKNGCGKSTLLKILNGGKISYTGELYLPKNLKISYVSQDTSKLCGNFRDFIQESGIDETLFKTILRKLDFSRAMFDKNVSDLSAGQKKKILIARSLCEQAHLYIWDEPLNYIDVFSRVQIENLIENCGPTMIFVEHDRAFTEKISSKIIRL
ncbi:Lsa family ABC-F type ribosomal protection protein [Clostridia bacterium]|nr:Lsa family ABC-F type ribosomal protection protein [Clostridia bacterium]